MGLILAAQVAIVAYINRPKPAPTHMLTLSRANEPDNLNPKTATSQMTNDPTRQAAASHPMMKVNRLANMRYGQHSRCRENARQCSQQFKFAWVERLQPQTAPRTSRASSRRAKSTPLCLSRLRTKGHSLTNLRSTATRSSSNDTSVNPALRGSSSKT